MHTTKIQVKLTSVSSGTNHIKVQRVDPANHRARVSTCVVARPTALVRVCVVADVWQHYTLENWGATPLVNREFGKSFRLLL